MVKSATSPPSWIELLLIVVLFRVVVVDGAPVRNTPPYRVGCFDSSGRLGVNVETNFRISAEYTTCCYYVDGEQLYACDKRTQYFGGLEQRLLFTTVDTTIEYGDIPMFAVEYLNAIYGFMSQIRDVLYHVTYGLNEMYACTVSAGANCTARENSPFRLFVEEPCIEDDDDDGSPLRDNDDYNHIRCPTLAHRAFIPGKFTTIIPDYTAMTGRVPGVDFDPLPLTLVHEPDKQLDYVIYLQARKGFGWFKRNDALDVDAREFIDTLLNYPVLARERNETLLRSMFASARNATAPFNYEHRHPLVRVKFTSQKTPYRYEDLVRFGRRVIDAVSHPGIDRTLSCLERFYFGDANSLGSVEIHRVRSLLTTLDRLSMQVDDDDGDPVDHFGMRTEHCYAGRRPNYRARAYQKYTVDVRGKRVCHPWEDDPMCEQKYGSNHHGSDVSHCIRSAYGSMQPIAEQITLSLQYIAQSLHSRLALIQEVLRISREVGSPTYRFPNDTQCFQNPFFKASTL